jgi:hypothetical protein
VSGPAYDQDFYRELDTTAATSARVVVPLLMEMLPVHSVVDLGCGDGGWLSVFREHDAEDVLGVDGPWIDTTLLKIPTGCFLRQRLDEPVTVQRRFDLAMSLEVAEHLPPARAAAFVAELVGLSEVVLFSAAIPGQGGHHHENEQWPAYWAELFAAHGYRGMDPFRRRLWEREDVTWWYRQNLVLYASGAAIAAHPPLRAAAEAGPPQALVHPQCFAGVVKRAAPGLGRWLKMGPAAARRVFSRRRRR